MIFNSIAVFLTVLLGLFLTKDVTTKMFVIAAVRSLYGVVRGIIFLPIYGAYCMNLKRNFFYVPILKSLMGLVVSLGVCWLIRLVYVPDNWMGFFIMSALVAFVSISIGSVLILTKKDKKFIMEKIVKHRK